MKYGKANPNLLNFIRERTNPQDSILDIGCGIGRYKDIPCKRRVGVDKWTGADADLYIDITSNIFNEENIGTFDVVLLLDVIEHLTLAEGKDTLIRIKKMVKRELLLLTPLFWDSNMGAVNEYNNPCEAHKSLWGVEDFKLDWQRITIPSLSKYYFGIWKNKNG